MTRTQRGTKGHQRALVCCHQPTGTVAWPLHLPSIEEAHASVYSCQRPACVEDAGEWVRECTGHPGVYRAFS